MPGVDYIECNVCDKEALMIALDGVELVFHTSAVIDLSPFPTRNLNGKPKIEEVNIGGTGTSSPPPPFSHPLLIVVALAHS